MLDKSIKKARMESYFIEAAKIIIETEGIKNVSVRKVGEKAGYSYATIYNYFKDINTLLAFVSLDYLNDAYQHMLEKGKTKTDALEILIIRSKEYFQYMANKPDIFKMIFLNDYGNVPREISESAYVPNVAKLLRESLDKMEIRSCIKDLDLLHGLITSSIHGKIMFFIGGRHNLSIDDMLMQIEKEIEVLING